VTEPATAKKLTTRVLIGYAWKTLSVLGLCAIAATSGVLRFEPAAASYSIERRCLANQPRKKKAIEREKTCACVVTNLQARLSPEQIKDLEKIYEGRASRTAAASDDRLRPILDVDYEVNKNCTQDALWHWPAEDMGKPDDL